MGAAEDKFKALEEKIKANADLDGSLVIKISQRQTLMPGMDMARSVPRLVCTLGGGSVTHLMNPEMWVPRLMGGGRFVLQAYAPGSTTSSIIDVDVDLGGDSRAVPDWDAVDESSWAGPRSLMFPTKNQRNTNNLPNSFPLSIASPPSTTTPNTIASQPSSSGTGGSGATHQEDMRRMQEQYQSQIIAMQAQAQALTQRLAEEQHRRELEAINAKHSQDMERMRREMQESISKIANQPPPPQGSSIGDTLKEVAPLVTTLFTGWMAMRAEQEKQAAERERRAEERQAEFMRSIANRPPIDPMLKEILDAQKANELPVSAILQQSAQATASVMATMSDMMIKFAEASAGPEENPMIKIAREVGAAIQGIVKASAGAPKPPRQLPPQIQPPQRVQEARPQPSEPPRPEVAAMGELPVRPVSLDTLKRMLEANEDPDKVARFVVASAQTPEFLKAIEAANYEPFAMFEALLGRPWIEANMAYVTAFTNALNAHVGQQEEAEEDEDT